MQAFPDGYKGLDHHGKGIAIRGEITIVILSISSEIDAQYPTVGMFLEQAPHPVGAVFSINPTCPRSPPFGKNEKGPALFEQKMALGQRAQHFFPTATPTDGDTFRQIQGAAVKKVFVEIHLLRQVPRHLKVKPEMVEERKKPVGNDERIYHGEMVRAYQPWTGMLLKKSPPSLPDQL